jgi:hypothetical protein
MTSHDIDTILDTAYEYFEEHENGDISVLKAAVEKFPEVETPDLIAMFFAYQDCVPYNGHNLEKVILEVKSEFPEWTATTPSTFYRSEASTLLEQTARWCSANYFIEILDTLVETGCDLSKLYFSKLYITEIILCGEPEQKGSYKKVRELVKAGAPKPRLSLVKQYHSEHDHHLLVTLDDVETFYQFE